MIHNSKKLAAFRQLSLNTEPPPAPREHRKILKKQFSEDIPDITETLLDSSIGIKVSFANKTLRKSFDERPPLKIAWAEENENAVIVTKCKENTRRPPILARRYSIEKDSILHSKQQLTERIEQTSENKTPEKTNINIYLAHDSHKKDCDLKAKIFDYNQENEVTEKVVCSPRPKFLSPLIAPENTGAKNIFQIRKNIKSRTNMNESVFPSSNRIIKSADRPSSVVVVPVIEQKQDTITSTIPNLNSSGARNEDDNLENSKHEEIFEKDEENIKPINVTITPVSSVVKRERFQKRTNSAFNSVINDKILRPPLMRSSSAPSKPDHRSKFVATKRRIKSSSKKDKKQLQNLPHDSKDKGHENAKIKLKALNRSISVNGGEIETMVSLVSPAESDNEDILETEKKEIITSHSGNKIKPASAIKSPHEAIDVQRNASLRKIVKSVSFQQSSIHAIRSFSASFPSRRTSMATTLALASTHMSKQRQSSLKVKNMNEKRNSVSTEDERDPKRRLVRSNTEDISTSSCTGPDDLDNSEPIKEITVELKEKVNESKEETQNKSESNDTLQENQNETEEKDEEETFDNPKEKQCWEMYCKMVDKGISVSYDTILRGMLTPTEYRMRKKKEIVPTDKDDS